MIKGNVKNAPAGRYFREIGYSQSYPWIVKSVSESGKTITLQKVAVMRDPEWVPSITAGGFAGHCDNQHEQTWLYSHLEKGWEVKIRLNKEGRWTHKGTRFQETDGPYEFYDYNF